MAQGGGTGLLAFDGVRHEYVGVDQRVAALGGIDLSVGAGEPVAVIGPSGCGKSTLLLAAAGMITPTAGSVRIDGTLVAGPRRRTALILQDFGLLPWKTAHDNAALGLQIRDIDRAEREDRTAASLASVGLSEFASAYPGELSGGMAQRIALARAIALDADLFLMDEPLSALDALTREDLQDLLLDLWRTRGHASVLVTHSIEEAVYLGKRVIVLSPRPAIVAAVIENPEMGTREYRDDPLFYERCVHVRHLLAEEGAVGRLRVGGGT